MVKLECYLFATPRCDAISRRRPDICGVFVVPVEQPRGPGKSLMGGLFQALREPARRGVQVLHVGYIARISCVTLVAVSKLLS